MLRFKFHEAFDAGCFQNRHGSQYDLLYDLWSLPNVTAGKVIAPEASIEAFADDTRFDTTVFIAEKHMAQATAVAGYILHFHAEFLRDFFPEVGILRLIGDIDGTDATINATGRYEHFSIHRHFPAILLPSALVNARRNDLCRLCQLQN